MIIMMLKYELLHVKLVCALRFIDHACTCLNMHTQHPCCFMVVCTIFKLNLVCIHRIPCSSMTHACMPESNCTNALSVCRIHTTHHNHQYYVALCLTLYIVEEAVCIMLCLNSVIRKCIYQGCLIGTIIIYTVSNTARFIINWSCIYRNFTCI